MASNQEQSGSGSGQEKKGELRGFAAMDEEKQRAISSKGGHAAHEKGTAHEFNSEEARKAGQKGGEEVSSDREHMAEIGRKGAESRAAHMAGERSQGSRQEEKQESKGSASKNPSSTRGGTPEQHAAAGRQSHKNQ